MTGLQISLFGNGARPFAGTRNEPRERVDVYALSIPARTFTGDFYFAECVRDSLRFAVGDVAGKGIAAAVVMEMIQEALDTSVTSADPLRTATALDTLLKSVLPANRFATAVFGCLAPEGSLHVVNAGHCPLLIARRDSTIDSIDSTGPVLGILPGARWRSAAKTVRRGEALLACSDGAIEARNAGDEEFGVERLRAAFGAAVRRHRTARAIAEAVERTIRRFAPGYDDDFTLVVARRG